MALSAMFGLAWGNDGGGTDSGHVRTYALNGDWTSDTGGSSSTGAICFTGDSLLTLEEYVSFSLLSFCLCVDP